MKPIGAELSAGLFPPRNLDCAQRNVLRRWWVDQSRQMARIH
jgi:hypothetical protein